MSGIAVSLIWNGNVPVHTHHFAQSGQRSLPADSRGRLERPRLKQPVLHDQKFERVEPFEGLRINLRIIQDGTAELDPELEPPDNVFRQLLLLHRIDGGVVQPRHIVNDLVVQLLVLGGGRHQPAFRLLFANFQVRADEGGGGTEVVQRAEAGFGRGGAGVYGFERRLPLDCDRNALTECQFRPGVRSISRVAAGAGRRRQRLGLTECPCAVGTGAVTVGATGIG